MSKARLFLLALILCLSLPRAYGQQPPPFPSFDERMVKTLIAQIDKPHNAAFLKIGYFALRANNPFPAQKGWELLRVACNGEKVGSKRWFILQDVRAYAAFRLSFTDKKEGFEAYSQIFDHAGEAAPAGADYYLSQAISEYVNSIPVSFQQFGVLPNQHLFPTLSSAWVAYVISERQATRSKYLWPDWSSAFDAVGVPVFLSAIVETQLADKSNRRTFGVLSSAGEILSYDKPERAIDVLIETKELEPSGQSQQTDAQIKDHVYDQLIDLLRQENRSDEAMTMSVERIHRLNRGRVQLVQLLYNKHDESAIKKIVVEMRQPNSPEDEVFAVAEQLYQLGYENDDGRDMLWDEGYVRLAVSLLESYVSTNRNKDFNQEVGARLFLSHMYRILKMNDKAISILAVQFPSHKDQEIVRLQAAVTARQKELRTVPKQK